MTKEEIIEKIDVYLIGFTGEICEVLNMDENDIQIRYEMNSLPFARYIPKEDCIIFNVSYCSGDLSQMYGYIYFHLAHELRHRWQFLNNKHIFDYHKTLFEVSEKEYDNQDEEIDANAFAVVLAESRFSINLDPFNKFERLKSEKLTARIIQIRKELFE